VHVCDRLTLNGLRVESIIRTDVIVRRRRLFMRDAGDRIRDAAYTDIRTAVQGIVTFEEFVHSITVMMADIPLEGASAVTRVITRTMDECIVITRYSPSNL